MPKPLFDQLRRLGITPERPTDVYSYDRNDDSEEYRITFHVVGKLLSGPGAWRETERLGSLVQYRELVPSPNHIGMAVFPHKRTRYPAPTLPAASTSPLIQVDIRMRVPLPDITE